MGTGLDARAPMLLVDAEAETKRSPEQPLNAAVSKNNVAFVARRRSSSWSTSLVGAGARSGGFQKGGGPKADKTKRETYDVGFVAVQ